MKSPTDNNNVNRDMDRAADARASVLSVLTEMGQESGYCPGAWAAICKSAVAEMEVVQVLIQHGHHDSESQF